MRNIHVGVGCRRAPLPCHDPQVSITRAPPRSFSPPSSTVSDNGERSLFPENDYADWKVRGGLAVRSEMKGETRLRERPDYVPRKKSITSRSNSRVDGACTILAVKTVYYYLAYFDSLQSLWEIGKFC